MSAIGSGTITAAQDDFRRARLASSRLSPRAAGGVAAVVRALGALQSQVPAAAALAVRARSTGLVAADVERARVADRSVVRAWAHRATLQLLPAEDLGWVLRALGPRMVERTARRYAQLGITEADAVAVERLLGEDGPLDRAAIGAALDLGGQALYAAIHRAGLGGRVCAGPGETFARVADWLGGRDAADPGDPLAELARRHLAAHAPAEPRDLAWWTGVRIPEARAAWSRIGGELAEVRPGSWALAHDRPPPEGATEPVVRLLGAFDAFLLGHRDRSPVLPPAHARRVQAGGGWLHPVVLDGGVAAATWRLDGDGLLVAPFARLDPGRLEAEAADLARFLDSPAPLRVVPA